MIRSDRVVFKIAAAGALAAALMLAGCGRKGDLDRPPAAAAVPAPDGQATAPTPPDGTSPPPKKGFILDWLIK